MPQHRLIWTPHCIIGERQRHVLRLMKVLTEVTLNSKEHFHRQFTLLLYHRIKYSKSHLLRYTACYLMDRSTSSLQRGRQTISSTENSATRQAGLYDWIISLRSKRYGPRSYSILPSIFYLRSKSTTRSLRPYSHNRFIRECAFWGTKRYWILQGQQQWQQTRATWFTRYLRLTRQNGSPRCGKHLALICSNETTELGTGGLLTLFIRHHTMFLLGKNSFNHFHDHRSTQQHFGQISPLYSSIRQRNVLSSLLLLLFLLPPQLLHTVRKITPTYFLPSWNGCVNFIMIFYVLAPANIWLY